MAKTAKPAKLTKAEEEKKKKAYYAKKEKKAKEVKKVAFWLRNFGRAFWSWTASKLFSSSFVSGNTILDTNPFRL